MPLLFRNGSPAIELDDSHIKMDLNLMAAISKPAPGLPIYTVCVGGAFSRIPISASEAAFPASIFSQTEMFNFLPLPSFSSAIRRLKLDENIALVFIDADDGDLVDLLEFIEEVRQIRPVLPLITFTARADDKMRYLLRGGVNWHFTKGSKATARLSREIDRHVLNRSERQPNSAKDLTRRSLASSWVNPYIVGRPLSGRSESLFTGRGEVFSWIGENLLANLHPNPLLLFGSRRIGKSSVLYQLVAGKHGRFIREDPSRPIIPVYIDLQRFSGSPTSEWLLRFAREIYKQAAPVNLTPTPPEVRVNGESPFLLLERTFDRLEAAQPENGLLLLAIDELEQLKEDCEAGNLDPAVFPFLRSQIQHRTGIAFLFSGSEGLLGSYWAPIMNLAAIRELGPLSYDETVALVREPVTDWIRYDEAAIDRIWHATLGHPYQVQVICHRLLSLIKDEHRSDLTISVANVDFILNDLRSVSPILPLQQLASVGGEPA
jgi:hypothetical protein